MPKPDPVYMDELAQRKLKTLRACECPGCRILHDGKGRFCEDHSTAESRVETVAEHEEWVRKLAVK